MQRRKQAKSNTAAWAAVSFRDITTLAFFGLSEAVPPGPHEEQHGNGEHRIGTRGEEGDATRLVLLLVGSWRHAQNLLLGRPDQRPDVEQHDGPQPRTDADKRRLGLKGEGRHEARP